MDNAGKKFGTLYVVAVPIGNPDDITVRALKILSNVDCVAAEDTRLTGRFLAHHSIKNRLISYYEHNEKKRAPELIDRIKTGASIALVSSAGTPSVSDPGYRLVKEAVAMGIEVTPIPGPAAAVAALSASGLPTDSFFFAGFTSKKKGKRMDQLNRLEKIPATIIFYESPRRILSLLDDLMAVLGNRYGILARELTKKFEEFIRGDLAEIKKNLGKRSEIRGECTLLVEGYKEPAEIPWPEINRELTLGMSENRTRLSILARNISKKHGVSKSLIYEAALKIKKQS